MTRGRLKVEGDERDEGAGEAGGDKGEELITHAQCPMTNDYLVSIVQTPSQDSGGDACW